MSKTFIALTVRSGSERLPRKCLTLIQGEPLFHWIAKRLSKITDSTLVITTTTDPTDDDLVEMAENKGYLVHRGQINDVVGRIETARQIFAPEAKFVLRGLGDCPFMEVSIIEHAISCLEKDYGLDNVTHNAFVWASTPDYLSRILYGAREFPYHITAWEQIVKDSAGDEREHIDLYFHRNRSKFNILHHEPPTNVYARDYRLEVDWPEDVELIQRIAATVGMEAPLEDVVFFLDSNDEVARINHQKVEKTGLTISFGFKEKRGWMRELRGKGIISWSGETFIPPSNSATPIFCKSGECLIGYGDNARLYLRSGNAIIKGAALLKCACGQNLIWNEPIPKS